MVVLAAGIGVVELAAKDPGGVPGEPGWQLPVAALRAAPTAGDILQLLAEPGGHASADRIAAALAVLPPSAVTGDLIERCDPDDPAISPLGRLRVIAAAERQVARLQARQDQWIASFARPGIAAPMDRLLDLVCDGRRGNSLHPAAAELIPLDVREDPVRFAAAVADRPDWQAALAAAAEKAAAAEVAAALGISPTSAGTRVQQAVILVDDFPSTLEAQLAGLLDRQKARTITATFSLLRPDQRAEPERQAIAENDRFTPAQFADRCEELLILADPAAAEQRAADAIAGRRTRRLRGVDGVGRFIADLPADKALLTACVLDEAAQRFPTDLRDGRTLDQLRADIFAGIFTNLAEEGHVDLRGRVPHDAPSDIPEPPGDPGPAGPVAPAGTAKGLTPQDFAPWSPSVGVTVTIAASTLAGLDDDPAQLAGHGWIHADLARSLAESASTIRLAINREDCAGDHHHPTEPTSTAGPPGVPKDRHGDSPGHERCDGDATCGGTLDHGRAVYRPPAPVKDYVMARDRVCRHPGCTRPAARCDLDHRCPYGQGGPTCPCNLDCLCRSHHRGKTFLNWKAIRLPGNHLQWTTPHGYTLTDHPDPTPNGNPFRTADLVTSRRYDPVPF